MIRQASPNRRITPLADFELRNAYFEGAKAARDHMSIDHNPFTEADKRTNWARGYQTVVNGSYEPIDYRPVAS
jgi:hypothetical protein